MVQMLGWFSAEAVWASRRKRAKALGSRATSGGRQKLEGDEAMQPRVLRLVNHAPCRRPPVFRGCGSVRWIHQSLSIDAGGWHISPSGWTSQMFALLQSCVTRLL